MTQYGAADPYLDRRLGRGPVIARAAAGREMNVRQPEGTAPVVGHEVVLQASDVPYHQPDPLGRRYLDRRRQERVLGHRDDDLALGRRSAPDEERAADQKTQSQQARSS